MGAAERSRTETTVNESRLTLNDTFEIAQSIETAAKKAQQLKGAVA